MFILHPGFLNREPGPDFHNAVVQFADAPARVGDIEVDTHPADWFHHKHDRNPAYTNVILHVVWTATPRPPAPTNLPMLELKPILGAGATALDAPSDVAAPWESPRFLTGKCALPLQKAGAQDICTLLQQAALFRLQRKGDAMERRAQDCGWTQTLWEQLFRALGYKHNTWPMLRLGELHGRLQPRKASSKELLARLLGIANLLPRELRSNDPSTTRYWRTLWDVWWRERDGLADCTFPRSIWRLAGLRPANHPQRRLALAAAWLAEGELPARLTAWCEMSVQKSALHRSLSRGLSAQVDPFWQTHYTFRSRRSSQRLTLLGPDRVTDLAANVILPWLWARARQGRRHALCREIEQRYLAWPASGDNAVLKQARRRLLGTRREALPCQAALQQGLLQVVDDFCNQSNSLCEQCGFPQLVPKFTG